MKQLINQLTLPDLLSLSGLVLAWISIVLLIRDAPQWAIIVSVGGALAFDILDGYVARKQNISSNLGKHLDSFIDVVTYLIFSSVLFMKYLSPGIIFDVLVGGCVLGFGILRLIRFTQEGLITIKNQSFYKGMPVYHVYFLMILLYFLSFFGRWWKGLNVCLILITCPLMISELRYPKQKKGKLIGLLIIGIVAMSVYIELWK